VPAATVELVAPAVAALAQHLRERGLRADVHITFVCGDPDVRLVVCRRAGADVSVELLATPAAEPVPDRWHAVRVRGPDRQVWQGPRHDAPAAEVAALVEALLSESAAPDPGRYLLLG